MSFQQQKPEKEFVLLFYTAHVVKSIRHRIMSRSSTRAASSRTSTCMRSVCLGVVLMACSVAGFSVDTSSKRAHIIQTTSLQMVNNQNDDYQRIELQPIRNNNDTRKAGRKRALVKKCGKAIALSTTLLYGPMLSVPLVRRTTGSTAHAASSVAADGSAYKFQDFKDVKKKLSLAPGANVQEYEEILAKVEVEGEEALENYKPGETTALTIGGSGEEDDSSSSQEQTKTKGRRASRRKDKKQSQVSEWESDEFGFGDDDEDDFDSGVISLGSGSASSSKLSPSKGKSGGGGGDVVLTDKMAYNNYKAPVSKTDHTKIIKKGALYSIFPVFVITMIRGQIKAYKERKFVKKGLAIKEEEYKQYLEEKKKKKKKLKL